MKKSDRIRLLGARLQRLFGRFSIFIGMILLFSLTTGGAADDLGRFLYGAILTIGLTIGIVIWWFMSRDQRELDRSHQLAAEVEELYPFLSRDEQEQAFFRRRGRERRVEALFYLILAALAALWFWAMRAIGAQPLSWKVGWFVIVPALLLIALSLLIASFLPLKDDAMPRLSPKVRPSIDPGKLKGGSGCRLSSSDKNVSAEEYLEGRIRQERGGAALLTVAIGFFGVLPLLLFGVGIAAVVVKGAPSWFLLFSGILALFSVSLLVFLARMPGSALNESPRKNIRRLRSSNCRVLRDSILSYRYDNLSSSVMLEFAQSGTLKLPLSAANYRKYFGAERNRAIVLSYFGIAEELVLLPYDNGSAAAPAEKSTPCADILFSEEALHEAALAELERLAPTRRAELEEDINQMLKMADYVRNKGYFQLTTEQQGQFHTLTATDMRLASPDIILSATESAVMTRLRVSRQQIAQMKRNPFVAPMAAKLVIAAAVVLLGILITGAIERATGASLGFVYLVISAVSGSLALSCADQIVNAVRFRKLQKAYRDPEYRRKVLDAAVYRELREQVKSRRENQNHH